MLRLFRGNSGFTLIEVMVAITILAAMSLAMFGATSQILRSRDLVEVGDEAKHGVSFAMNKMAQDLNSAFLVNSAEMLGPKFGGEVGFMGKEDRLDFASFSHLRFIQNAPESDMCEISYFLTPDADDPDVNILMRRESTVLDKDGGEGGKTYPLLEGIRRLEFNFLPAEGKEYKKEWDTKSASSGKKLPRAVKIEMDIMLPDAEEPRKFTTVVPIRLRDPLVF